MADGDAKIDNLLLKVLHDCKTVPCFLRSIFGFLHRHTDFYFTTGKMGFNKEYRKGLVLEALNYFDSEKELQNFTPPAYTDTDCFVPPAVEEIEIDSSASKEEMEIIHDADEQPPDLGHLYPLAKSRNELPLSTPKSNTSETLQPKVMPQIKELNKVSPTFSPEEYKNGAVFKTYCWSQTISEIEAHIVLPVNIHSAKQLSISIEVSTISVQNSAENTNILEGKLWGKCRHHDVLWTMQDGKLNIHIDKMQEIWWDKFLTNEDAIDPRSIEYERDLSELPEETQAKIHKIRSKEINQNNLNCATEPPPVVMPVNEQIQLLRKAWDAEDSPFKGTPFNPSVLKLS